MNPTRLTDVRAWCRANRFHPNRVMGQNFLVDANVAEAILNRARIEPGERVLEIGPGLGVLSEGILARGARLCAMEKDPVLCAFLKERWRGRKDVRILLGDALEADLDALLTPPAARLVSNLPYASGTRILLLWLEHPQAPPEMHVTVQYEVALRLCARAKEPGRSLAGVWTQLLYEPSITRRISPTCFWPSPEVSSAVVCLARRGREPLEAELAVLFRELTRCAFTYRRKQLAVALRFLPRDILLDEAVRHGLFREAGVDPDARAEVLNMEQWIGLSQAWRRAVASMGMKKSACFHREAARGEGKPSVCPKN